MKSHIQAKIISDLQTREVLKEQISHLESALESAKGLLRDRYTFKEIGSAHNTQWFQVQAIYRRWIK